MNNPENLNLQGIEFTDVTCKICGRIVESFALPFLRAERIKLRCSRCGNSDRVVAWFGEIQFMFTENGISTQEVKEKIIKYEEEEREEARFWAEQFAQDKIDAEYDLAEAMYEEPVYYTDDPRSPIVWDADEEEWTNF